MDLRKNSIGDIGHNSIIRAVSGEHVPFDDRVPIDVDERSTGTVIESTFEDTSKDSSPRKGVAGGAFNAVISLRSTEIESISTTEEAVLPYVTLSDGSYANRFGYRVML